MIETLSAPAENDNCSATHWSTISSQSSVNAGSPKGESFVSRRPDGTLGAQQSKSKSTKPQCVRIFILDRSRETTRLPSTGWQHDRQHVDRIKHCANWSQVRGAGES